MKQAEILKALGGESPDLADLVNLDRRSFIKLSGALGGGFAIAALAPASLSEENVADLVSGAKLNAFVRVSSDGKITICGNCEISGYCARNVQKITHFV